MQETSSPSSSPNKKTSSHEVIKNGVNLSNLRETIRAIGNQPDLANFKFRVSNQWKDGAHNQAQVEDFYGTGKEIQHQKTFRFEADEPPVLLGKDQGANPVEILLSALSSCMTTTLAVHGAAQGYNMENIQSEFEGDIDLHGFLGLDPNVREGYQEIRVKFKVDGEGDEAALQELLKKSPVFNSLSQGVPIKISVEKNH